jgi:hypothetical protein
MMTRVESTPAPAVSTRRQVQLVSIADLVREVDRVVAAAQAGRVRPVGNWSAAQVLQHIGRLIEFSLDGFPFRYPWHLRWTARLIRCLSWRLLLSLAFRPGFRNPPQAAALEPDPAVTPDEAASYLRRQLARIQAGEQMTQPSPAEGPYRTSNGSWLTCAMQSCT